MGLPTQVTTIELLGLFRQVECPSLSLAFFFPPRKVGCLTPALQMVGPTSGVNLSVWADILIQPSLSDPDSAASRAMSFFAIDSCSIFGYIPPAPAGV